MAVIRILIFIALMASIGFAQTPAPVTNQGVITVASSDCSAANSCITLAISPNHGGSTIALTGTVGTVQFEATSDGSNWVSIFGTPVSLGSVSTSATATGLFQFNTAGMVGLRARNSVCSACSVSVVIVASASPPISAGPLPLPVTLTNGTFVTNYAGTGGTATITMGLSSGNTVMTSATVLVQTIRCNNKTGSNVNLAVTDTAGNVYTGDSTVVAGFTIPAWSEDYPILPDSFIQMTGIKMYANTAAALNCQIVGKQ